jgi:hypothetical protein
MSNARFGLRVRSGSVGSIIRGLSAADLLLNIYPNATAAYSLRKLKEDYNGSCIRVRRSIDNTELNIGFNGLNLDTTTLLSFVGVGDGFVTIWYDQSGNVINATQAAIVRQPLIVSSGNLNILNTNPAIFFSGSTFLSCGMLLSINNIRSYYSVNNATSTTQSRTIFSNGYNNTGAIYVGLLQNVYRYQSWIQGENNLSFSIDVGNSQHIVNGSYEVGNNGIKRYINGIPDTQYTTTRTLSGANTTAFAIGYSFQDNSYFWIGNQQELILYPNADTVNRIGIQNNINSYYNIY